MSEETLFTAARRAIRNFNIDMNRGGLIGRDTELALAMLEQMVRQTEHELRAANHETVVGFRPRKLPLLAELPTNPLVSLISSMIASRPTKPVDR